MTTNVALVSIVLLLYWVFAFVSITVFNFKIFRENLTQIFYLSVLGILALICGSLAVNIVLNLSRIADALSEQKPTLPSPGTSPSMSRGKLYSALLIVSFPLLFALLYFGDHVNSLKKERYLIEAASHLIENNRPDIEKLSKYSFDRTYAIEAAKLLKVLGKQNEHFPEVAVILRDVVGEKPVFLSFTSYENWTEKEGRDKADFLYPCSEEEREYLSKAFAGEVEAPLFSSADGAYELYQPIRTSKGVIVMYFNDRSQYGKFGS